MITTELIDYIKASIALGKTNQEIKTVLLNSGSWTPSDVDEAFLVISRKDTVIVNNARNSSRKLVMLLLLIALLGVGGWYAHATNTKKKQAIAIQNQAQLLVNSPVNNMSAVPTPTLLSELSTSNSVDLGEKITAANFSSTIKQGNIVKCSTIIELPNNGKLSSNFFFSMGKFRQENDLLINGESTKTYILDDGNYKYSWGSGDNEGSKVEVSIKISVEDMLKIFNDDSLDMTCNVWQTDSSKFTPPTNINWQ